MGDFTQATTIYVREDQLRSAIARLGEGSDPMLQQRMVVSSFEGEPVAHVHVEPADGRIAGNPSTGLLTAVRLPPGQQLDALSADEQLRLVQTGLSHVQGAEGSFLAVFCASDESQGDVSALSCWFDPVSGRLLSAETRFVPGADEVFSRSRGLLETDALAQRSVAVFGLGSGGAPCALELAKSGVGRFHLVDFDRLEASNVARHPCGLSALGRLKTRAVRDLILDKNPACSVETHDMDVTADPARVSEIVAASDLVIAGTDNNPSRRIINRACLEHGKVGLYGRAMVRACAGDVLRVRPFDGPCYECVLKHVWSHRPDEEVSRPDQQGVPQYADRPTAVMPGLSNDIAPLSNMIVKLALLELGRGSTGALQSLEKDYASDFYFWANRREEQYSDWLPMGNRTEGLSVLRWYGAQMPRHEQCPACGRSEPEATPSQEDVEFFSG
jgi:molybdopterin/thiamine biosynthesis adenylyltransferase